MVSFQSSLLALLLLTGSALAEAGPSKVGNHLVDINVTSITQTSVEGRPHVQAEVQAVVSGARGIVATVRSSALVRKGSQRAHARDCRLAVETATKAAFAQVRKLKHD